MAHTELSITEQCALVELHRSTYYYGAQGETEENLMYMRRIDELYTDNPAWGSRKMRDRLREEGHDVNRKRIQRLMRLMGIQALYPKGTTSRPNPEAGIHPYLLVGMEIVHANQMWCTDITYIRLKHGFAYLVAIMDWYSRKILSWELSITMDKLFCLSALDHALNRYGAPAIFNSDQGSQFTSPAFTQKLSDAGIRISTDGKKRALDTIMIERFWRSLKYEEIYLMEYADVNECRSRINDYIVKYNSFRPHQSLFGKTPDSVYGAGLRSIVDAHQVYSEKMAS